MSKSFGVQNKLTTRTAETVCQYGRHVGNIIRQSGLVGRFQAKEHRSPRVWFELVQWFVAQNGRWSKSTIRVYRAALTCAVQANIQNAIDREAILHELGSAVAPAKVKNACTASVKRKSIPQFEVDRLVAALDLRSTIDALVGGFLRLAPLVGLRPREFFGAQVSGDQFRVRNAKATNGRANGVFRDLDLSQLSGDEVAALKGFLAELQRTRLLFRSTKHLLNCIAARLARVCKKLKIPRVALYTLRHVGLASAKQQMSTREVAALAGHKSCVTATRHYAKRRTGWFGLRMARPTVAAIEAVHDDVYRTSRLLNMDPHRGEFRTQF